MGNIKTLKPFKPGNRANPLGAGAHDPLKREIKKLTQASLEELLAETMGGDREALKKIIADPNTPILKLIAARALFNAGKHGNWAVTDSILNRAIGRVPTKLEHTGADGGPIEVSRLEDDAIKQKLEALRAKRAAKKS